MSKKAIREYINQIYAPVISWLEVPVKKGNSGSHSSITSVIKNVRQDLRRYAVSIGKGGPFLYSTFKSLKTLLIIITLCTEVNWKIQVSVNYIMQKE